MLMLGDLIPKLKTRSGKQGGAEQSQPQSSSNPKKGKGKGRRCAAGIFVRTFFFSIED